MEEQRHYFVGRFYPTPKSSDDPAFSRYEDFTPDELTRIDVQGLKFRYNHDEKYDIGTLLTSFGGGSGSRYVIGYIDTSTPIGRHMVFALTKGRLDNLSMSHASLQIPNISEGKQDVANVPLEISLVDFAARDNCKVLFSADASEIQHNINILVESLQTMQVETLQRYIREMSNPSAPPSAPPVQAATSSATSSAPSVQVPPVPTLDDVAKLYSTMKPDLLKDNMELLNAVPGVVGKLFEELIELRPLAKEKKDRERTAREKEKTELTELRNKVLAMMGDGKDDPEKQRIANAITTQIEAIAEKNPTALPGQTSFYKDVLAYGEGLKTENQRLRKAAEDRDRELKDFKQRENLFSLNRGFSTETNDSAPKRQRFLDPLDIKTTPPAVQTPSSAPQTGTQTSALTDGLDPEILKALLRHHKK
jgi:hypothetical protein